MSATMSSMDVFSVVLNRYAETHAAEVCKVQIETRRPNVEVTLPLARGANTLVSWQGGEVQRRWELFKSPPAHVYPNPGTYVVYVVGGKRHINDSRSNRFTGFGFPELKTATDTHIDTDFTAIVTAIGTVPMRLYSISRMPRPDEHRLCMNQDQYNRLHPAAQDQMTPCPHCRMYVPSSNFSNHEATIGDNCDGQDITSETYLKIPFERENKSELKIMTAFFRQHNLGQYAFDPTIDSKVRKNQQDSNMCFYLSCSFQPEMETSTLESKAVALKKRLREAAANFNGRSTETKAVQQAIYDSGGSYDTGAPAGHPIICQYIRSTNTAGALCIIEEEDKNNVRAGLFFSRKASLDAEVMFLHRTGTVNDGTSKAENGHYTRLEFYRAGFTFTLGLIRAYLKSQSGHQDLIPRPLAPADDAEIEVATLDANRTCEEFNRVLRTNKFSTTPELKAPIVPDTPAPWSCTACTFDNAADVKQCHMCHTDKPSVAPTLPIHTNSSPLRLEERTVEAEADWASYEASARRRAEEQNAAENGRDQLVDDEDARWQACQYCITNREYEYTVESDVLPFKWNPGKCEFEWPNPLPISVDQSLVRRMMVRMIPVTYADLAAQVLLDESGSTPYWFEAWQLRMLIKALDLAHIVEVVEYLGVSDDNHNCELNACIAALADGHIHCIIVCDGAHFCPILSRNIAEKVTIDNGEKSMTSNYVKSKLEELKYVGVKCPLVPKYGDCGPGSLAVIINIASQLTTHDFQTTFAIQSEALEAMRTKHEEALQVAIVDAEDQTWHRVMPT